MNESYSKTNKKINTLLLDDMYKTLNNLLKNIQNDINILAYLESSITNNKYITPQDAHQTILLNLKKLKIDSIKIKKQIEDFSFNNNNFNKYNQYKNDGIIKNTIKTFNEKYKKLLFNIKEFIIKYPILIDLREEFLSTKLNSFSFKKIKKNKNKTLSISNVKNKNNNSFGNYKNNHNNNNISDRNISINDYINSNSKKLKKDILINKIKKIQINFDGSQLDTTNEKSSKIYDISHITPSNRYINDLKLKSFVQNSTNTNTNITNDLNLNNSISKEKLLFIPKNKSFLKRENQIIISNKNKSYQVHNSFNNSSINLNITNHKHINKNNNINYINKFIPNNYHRKNQMNSLENRKKLKTNQNVKNFRLIGKTSKNNKSFNFPIKSLLFEQNLNKKIKFKKLKPSITLKDKDKINCTYITTIGQGINKIKNNNLKSYKGILYTNPVKNEKRSNSEYFFKSIKNDINISKINKNSSMNNNNKKLRGFSLDTLNWNKLDIQNLEKNEIKKKKTKVRNRAINIFSESPCNGAATAPNRNMSFNQFVNSKVINNDKVEFENISNNENIIIDYDKYKNTREENTKLKKEVISLKKEIENLKFMYQDLSMKVSNLEEQNQILKKENNTIKFCNMYQK